MSTGQQLGLIGSSVRVQSLPTASAATFGEGNRFYTLIGQQAGYITGHTYRTVMANDVYSWEDVRNELMLLALVDGTITANSSIEVPLSNFNRQPLVDNLLIVYSNANQYALMKVSAVTSTAATLIVKDNSAANIVSTKGATGAAGVGITNTTAGEPIVADEKTTTPITFSFSDGTTKEFNVEAQNGTDGAQGIGVKSITSGTPTVVNDKTNTPITITLTDNTIVGLVVSAENGKDGTSATVDIVQATGQSTTAVMSQKAVTDELNKKANTSDIPTKTSQLTNDSNYATKSYVDTQDDKKLDKAGGSVTGNLAIGGNLIVNGSTTSIDSTTLKVSDKLIEVAKDNTVKLTTPAGIVVPKYDGRKYGALVIDGDGNAQVGNVNLDSSGNIDVTTSDLQILATREGLTDGNLVKWNDTKKTLVPDTTVASNASSALSKANANATEISTIKTTYQTKTDNTLGTTSKTVVGAINEVKGTADSALSKANANATEISNIKNGTTVVKNADHANAAVNTMNVTTNINGKAISSIFETNGTTVKEATHAGKATSADKATQANNASKVTNSLTFSGQNAQGTESTIGFDGSQAQEVDFNGDDFVATKGNAFEVSLAPSGVTAGTYNNVTIDEKGRATAGSNKDYATTAQVKAKYTKPESGIPKSDLAVSVQTSLDKADTALQSAPVTSVNGKTGDVTGLATQDEVNAKQNALTETQLVAVNSGITEAKRTKYDGYEEIINQKANRADLATVATSGSYNDLLNKPTIPTDYVPNTRKVNNKALSSDITLGPSDVGALPTTGGTVTGNLAVGGNLTVNGTTTTVNSTTLQVKDKLIEVAHGNTAALTTPAGLVAPKYDGANSGALVFDSTGTAYVGDVKFDSTGNIDVPKSGLQPLATRTGLVGGNLVQYDSTALTLKDSGKKISDLALTSQVNAMLEYKQDKITSSNKLSSSLIDGLGAAAAKAVDTAISANSTSTNLPTSKAVEDRINAHSGIDKVGTVTGVKMNGTTKNPSSGVVDIGTVITDVSDKQDKITSSNKLAASLVSGLANVATSGSYNDLSNKPTIPAAANNGTLTIQKNGTTVATFSANQSGNATANIIVPTKASDVNALSLDGGTIKKSKTIKMDASANSDGANLKWGTVNSKNPYIGYASDQSDGTFVVGSLLGTNYASGLAIGGGSGNLLWKGTKVATTNDIPTVNNGTLTIQKNGTNVATFGANQSTNATANITVPVKVSELTNDSGFTTNKGTVTQVKINETTKSPNSSGLVDLGTGFAKTADLPIKSASLSGTTLYLTL